MPYLARVPYAGVHPGTKSSVTAVVAAHLDEVAFADERFSVSQEQSFSG